MDDLISRQAVLDILNRSAWKTPEELEVFESVKKLPSVQPEQRWIPISERLPEEDGDYFVTLENGVVTKLGYSTAQRTTYPKGFYYISNGFSWRQIINPVIAWMPLPEKYQPEEVE